MLIIERVFPFKGLPLTLLLGDIAMPRDGEYVVVRRVDLERLLEELRALRRLVEAKFLGRRSSRKLASLGAQSSQG